MKRIFTLLFLLPLVFSAKSQSSTIVISQLYGGGGATSGTPAYHDDYIELHNVSNASVTLPNWSLQYGSQNGNIGGSATSRVVLPANLVIPAGGYYLIQITSTGGTVIGATLPTTPDFTVSANPAMSATNGKVALLSDTTLLKCGQTSGTGGATPCATWPPAALVDLVGYGKLPPSVSNCEGCTATDSSHTVGYVGTTANSLNSRVVAVRKNGGCQDTQDNAADFDTIPSAVPRNSATTPNTCSTTPVTLSDFSAFKSNSSVSISWITEFESNNKAFIVQRSKDGINWVDILTVDGSGNSTTKKSYSTVDKSPLSGFNYYRLKQVYTDGSYNLSAIRKVLFSNDYKVLVSPNPAKDFINIYVSKTNNEVLNIKISDVNGKVVNTTTSALSAIQISTAGFSKGIYFVKISDSNNTTTQKILVR